jgi:hypothetical protein
MFYAAILNPRITSFGKLTSSSGFNINEGSVASGGQPPTPRQSCCQLRPTLHLYVSLNLLASNPSSILRPQAQLTLHLKATSISLTHSQFFNGAEEVTDKQVLLLLDFLINHNKEMKKKSNQSKNLQKMPNEVEKWAEMTSSSW